MSARKESPPPPLASVHRDDRALEATLLAAGMVVVQLETLMNLEQIPEIHRRRVAELLRNFNHAYYGDHE